MLNIIPESVVCDIFCEWCDLFEIVKFNSAVSAKKQRGHLQQLYSKRNFLVNIKLTSNRLHSLAWCTLKGLSVSKIEVTSQDQLEHISTVYPAYSTSIKYITWDPMYFQTTACKIHPFVEFANSCGKLRGISLKDIILSPQLMNINVDTLVELATFDSNSYYLSHSFIAYMAQHCRQLTSLTSNGFGAENELILIDIIDKNEKLRDIHIVTRSFNLSFAILDILTNRMDSLSTVYLSNCSKIPFRSLIKFILVASKTLKSLKLTTGFHFDNRGFNYFLGRDYNLGDTVISSVHISLDEVYNDINSTADLMYIFEHLTTLDHITFVRVGDILTDEIFHLIAKSNSKLSRLKVIGNLEYCVKVLKDIFKNCKQVIRFSKY